MHTFLIFLLLFICFIAFCYIAGKFKFKKYGMFALAVICGVVFLLGVEVLNLTVVSDEVKEKVDQVADICGDTYIRVDGNKVEVLLNDKWVDLDKISIIGGILGDEITLRYEDKEIYLGQSGIVNTIKALESVGLIKSE